MSRPTPKCQTPTLRQALQEHTRTAYREAILDAAERVFIRVGFHDAKMAEIAAEASVSVGTLYNHFESKEVIFASIGARCREQYAAALEGASDIADPMDQLRAIVLGTLEFIEAHGALFAVYMQLGSLKATEIRRVGGQEAEDNYLRFLAMLEAVMTRASAAGAVRADVGPDVLAAALASMVNGALFAWVRRQRQGRLTDSADLILKLFLEGARRL